jgi:ketosteroid isomerase-like protein
MSTEENKRVVQTILEAFGRGDIPGMLAHVSEDVVWNAPGPSVVPYLGDRRGHSGVTEFFVQLGTNVDFESFEPGVFIAEGEHVVLLGRERGRVKATTKTFDNEWALVFQLRDGKVVHFHLYENTGAVAEAFS